MDNFTSILRLNYMFGDIARLPLIETLWLIDCVELKLNEPTLVDWVDIFRQCAASIPDAVFPLGC